MTTAGELRHRVSLWGKGPDGEDGWGQPVPGEFEEQGVEHAKIHFLRGGETVMAGRLQGTQPAIFTVRSNSLTRSMDLTWEIRTEDGARYNVRSINDPDGRNAWLEILAEKGLPS